MSSQRMGEPSLMSPPFLHELKNYCVQGDRQPRMAGGVRQVQRNLSSGGESPPPSAPPLYAEIYKVTSNAKYISKHLQKKKGRGEKNRSTKLLFENTSSI